MISVKEVAKKLDTHIRTISPGQPFHLNGCHSINDRVCQGDLNLTICAEIPKGYELIKDPTDADRQLVPLDGSPGSHHRLQSFDGVVLYRKPDWGTSDTDLSGPVVVFDKPNAIVHEPGTSTPHGTVFVDDPMIIACTYQRNLTADERAEKRARD